jgi:uncharacterized protein (UPF0264 family)
MQLGTDRTCEIEALTKNLDYYTNQIKDICKEQVGIDAGLDRVNTDAGSTRFMAIGATVSACGWIETLICNIRVNAKTAIAEGKKLNIFEPEEEE